ncbi:hypothetical protein DQW50_07320 [Halorubrum sp. 48-1-W]|uniref:hypothetical protein n=1 Tax=Halorubrum sp. 48-1-W TaxID=2249761 RepID=UPI000DCCD658|nr:hypothetical protein [Halorubrum sp. 48-1-W]RAW45816.1 hypothetical protein DQW50_07320 [Halorubrum sp. 48-1-W]
MSLGELFRDDPTRDLEEVQTVRGRDDLATDVREFHQTESAERVLTELGDIVEAQAEPRFLYVEATFGSGKTHLLKLTGLVVDGGSPDADLGDQLAEKWAGFNDLQQSLTNSHVDRLEPVFLNLLDRDASKEPPLPFLIFEGMGRELGYPTDPNWLLEWAWRLDMEYDGVWEALQSFEHEGQTFDDVRSEKAFLRTWLYSALPELPETDDTDLDTEADVKASIDEAVADVDPESFGPEELVERVETATETLDRRSGGTRAEFMFGLDEVALFVGDSTQRYREFEETMDALQHGPNPVVVTTGQYSPPATRESLIGESADDHWTQRQVTLEGADTEIVVRKRWLEKSTTGGNRVSELLSSMPDLTLDAYGSIASVDPDPVASYPFRSYDLSLLRAVMQELVTQGRETDRDYIQGRALLVLVRSLFTKLGWADKAEGALVTWDVLFDLLVEETPYVPIWVQDMLGSTLIPTFGDEDAREVRVAKALYLLNRTPAVPATPENLGRLLVGDVTASIDTVVGETTDALETLVDKRLVLTETTDEGDEEYTLVSEEQEGILSRAQTKAEQVSPHQLSAWVEARLREHDSFLRSEETRHEVDVGDERLVPLRYEYSILDTVSRAPNREHDALRVRVLATGPEELAEQIDIWQEVNDGLSGGEHLLCAIEVPDGVLDRIRNVIGMEQVLGAETETHEDLQREHRTNKRRLEAAIAQIIEDARVHDVHEQVGTREAALEDAVRGTLTSVFGDHRRVLSRPLVEVDDAKAMASFFRGDGSWPLTDVDATLLGVDTAEAGFTEEGWAAAFVDRYESRKAVDAETVLRQTRTANGDYRGTPRESIAALLITLATSNEDIALKRDIQYVTDPAAIGRAVRTKGGLTSLQVRFDVDITDPKKVRTLAGTVVGSSVAGSGPDEWMAELGDWAAGNSMDVKRTVSAVEREFGVDLDALEAVLRPALQGETLSTSTVRSGTDLDAVLSDAETFRVAWELFVPAPDEESLWERFETALDELESLGIDETVAARMRKTASASTVPSVDTVEARIEDARGRRVDHLTEQYRRVTGETPASERPVEIRERLTDRLRENDEQVHDVLERGATEFEGVAFDALDDVLTAVRSGEVITESDLADDALVGDLETYETCRELFTEGAGGSRWASLCATHDRLQEEHPDSPTTDAIAVTLGAAVPPEPREVDRLLAAAEDPRQARPDDDRWKTLQERGNELRVELPNADVTDEVTTALEAEERPDEARVEELLAEAGTLLERVRGVRETLDGLEDGSIVVIETSV